MNPAPPRIAILAKLFCMGLHVKSPAESEESEAESGACKRAEGVGCPEVKMKAAFSMPFHWTMAVGRLICYCVWHQGIIVCLANV